LVPWALAAFAFAITGLVVVKRIRGLPGADLGRQASLLIAAALTVPILMHPYTAFLQQDRGRTGLVMTEQLVYQHAWQNRQTDKVRQWMLDGGSTLGCDIDPGECAVIHRAESDGKVFTPEELRDALVEAIVSHPLPFIGNRVSYVWNQWFADELGSYSHKPTNYSSGPVLYSSSNNLNPGQGLLYLLLLIAATVAAIILALRGRWALLIIPAMVLAMLAPFAIVHVEVRYLIPLKLIGLLAPILILMLREQPARSKSAQVVPESIPEEVS
jgi:hypothetical protein